MLSNVFAGSCEFRIVLDEEGNVRGIGLHSPDGNPNNKYVFSKSGTKVSSVYQTPDDDEVFLIGEIAQKNSKIVLAYSSTMDVPIVVLAGLKRKTIKTVFGIGFCVVNFEEVLKSIDQDGKRMQEGSDGVSSPPKASGAVPLQKGRTEIPDASRKSGSGPNSNPPAGPSASRTSPASSKPAASAWSPR